VDIAQ